MVEDCGYGATFVAPIPAGDRLGRPWVRATGEITHREQTRGLRAGESVSKSVNDDAKPLPALTFPKRLLSTIISALRLSKLKPPCSLVWFTWEGALS